MASGFLAITSPDCNEQPGPGFSDREITGQTPKSHLDVSIPFASGHSHIITETLPMKVLQVVRDIPAARRPGSGGSVGSGAALTLSAPWYRLRLWRCNRLLAKPGKHIYHITGKTWKTHHYICD